MVTDRLLLVPGSLALCDAEDDGPAAVGRALGTTVPADWPPAVFEPDDVARVRRQLLADPGSRRWTPHYLVRRPMSQDDRPTLIGIAGFVAPPGDDGAVEIGYALVPEFQGVGFATEAVRALVASAFSDSRVRVIVANTYPSLRQSISVLRKTGFVEASPTGSTELLRFECRIVPDDE